MTKAWTFWCLKLESTPKDKKVMVIWKCAKIVTFFPFDKLGFFEFLRPCIFAHNSNNTFKKIGHVIYVLFMGSVQFHDTLGHFSENMMFQSVYYVQILLTKALIETYFQPTLDNHIFLISCCIWMLFWYDM